MRRGLLSVHDEDAIIRDSVEITVGLGKQSLCYRVVEATAATSGNPIDPLMGEPINPFELPTTTRSYVQFTAEIAQDGTSTSYKEGGSLDKRHLTLNTLFGEFDWQWGDMVLVDGVVYRVTSIDPRGIYSPDRIRLRLEQVT